MAGNTLGVQIFRSSFSLARSVVADNVLAGVHAREVEGTISDCLIAGNAPGLRASEGRLRIERNRIVGNGVGGLHLRRTEARVEGNRIASNSGNAISADSPGAVFRANGIEGNLRFAVGNNSAAPVDAAGNWWGTPAPTSDAFFDAEDDPRLGRVLTEGALASAPPLP